MLLWDIEATNLNADFGYCLAIAVMELGKTKPDVFTIRDYPSFKGDPTNDKGLVKEVSDILINSGAWINWYGQRYDVPYVNSRLVNHGLGVMPPVPNIDLWRVCREKLKLHSNRLASAAAFLGIEEKTRLSGPIWIKAGAGDKGALKYVEDHARQDVVVLAQAFEKMRPLITTGPSLCLLSGGSPGRNCTICSSTRLQKRGIRVASSNTYHRVECQDCGKWDQIPISKRKAR